MQADFFLMREFPFLRSPTQRGFTVYIMEPLKVKVLIKAL